VKANYKVKTDKKGHYYYGGLSIGMYNVTLEIDGKDVDQINGIRSTLGDPKEVNFDLKQINARTLPRLVTWRAWRPCARSRTRDECRRQGQVRSAEEEQEAAMAKNKALNDAFNAAREAQNAKNYDAAIENFTKASEMGPEQHVIWGNMADAYSRAPSPRPEMPPPPTFRRQAESYQKAITIKPDDAAYHNNYALVLAKAKKYDEAQSELTKAAQLDPPQAGKYYFQSRRRFCKHGPE